MRSAFRPRRRKADYDLVVIGSPTWWLTVNMPIRSYLKSPAAKNVLKGKPFAAYSTSRRYWKGNMTEVQQLGEEAGGIWHGETHFLSLGNQVNSMMSWLAFMKHGEPRKRFLGLKMPPPNLKPDFEEQAKHVRRRPRGRRSSAAARRRRRRLVCCASAFGALSQAVVVGDLG